MSQLLKLRNLTALLQLNASTTVAALEKGMSQETYERSLDAFWEYAQSLGYTTEDLAIAYDDICRQQLSPNYSWGDWAIAYNQIKNEFMDKYSITVKIHPLEQAALDIVKNYYAAANVAKGV